MDIISVFMYIISGTIAIVVTGLVFLVVGYYLIKGQFQRWQ